MNENFDKPYDNDNKPQEGQITGFDFTEKKSDTSSKTPNSENEGFYTKSHDEIIQDSPSDAGKSSFKSDYMPSGSYTPRSDSSTENTDSKNFYNSYSKPSSDGLNNDFYKPQRQRREKHFGAVTVIVASVLAAVVGALSGVGALLFIESKADGTVLNNSYNGPTSNVNINVDKTVESVVEAVAEKVSPSVVGIRTTTSVMSFFGGSSEATGEGSGVIYSSDGYIITNYHVIESVAQSSTNAKIEVFLNNNTEKSYEAKIIGYHISSDLAVIKINATGLPKVTIADSDELNAGQYVIAIGSPGGLEFMGSVTYGIISGLDRVVSSSSGISLIQTDAAINPGNSGGALLNTSGELIGINSSKIVSEEYEGMGFAIPSNTVVEKCERIINRKDAAEPYVGITISEKYTPAVLEYYGYPVGAVVLSVDDGSPADKTGVRRGDIIIEFDGKKISDYALFEEYLHDTGADTTVEIKIYRSGKYYTADLKIASNGAAK